MNSSLARKAQQTLVHDKHLAVVLQGACLFVCTSVEERGTGATGALALGSPVEVQRRSPTTFSLWATSRKVMEGYQGMKRRILLLQLV
jgi:hypothetical protein